MTSVSIATTTPPQQPPQIVVQGSSSSMQPFHFHKSGFYDENMTSEFKTVILYWPSHQSLSLKIIETQHSTRNKKHLIHFLSEFMFQSTLDWRIQKCGRRHIECSRFQVHHCWKHEVVSVVQHEHEDIRDFFLVFLHHLTFPLFFFPPSVWQRPFKCFNTF